MASEPTFSVEQRIAVVDRLPRRGVFETIGPGYEACLIYSDLGRGRFRVLVLVTSGNAAQIADINRVGLPRQ